MNTRLFVVLATLILGGCATASSSFPEHTIFLGEVAHIASRDNVLKGLKLGPDKLSAPKSFLDGCGYEEKNIRDESFVLVRYFYYWHNVASGIVRNGTQWVAVPSGLALEPGNIVEVERVTSSVDPHIGCTTVSRIRFENLKSGQCEYRKNKRNPVGAALDVINPIGGPGSASIYCPSLETAGWKQVPSGPWDALAWTKTPPRTGK